jgi:hypothetical protein
MPAQKRPWRDQKHATRGKRQVPRRRREQRPIRPVQVRPPNLAAQNLELVTQHQQLDILQIQAAATPNKCAKQSPKREVKEGEDHAADPPTPRPEGRRHEYWRPSRARDRSRRASGESLPRQNNSTPSSSMSSRCSTSTIRSGGVKEVGAEAALGGLHSV